MTDRIVFKDANLIDGIHDPRPGTTVVVSGNRIESVGSDAATPQAGDRVYELGGRTLMPGMVICHFHAQFHHVGEGAQLGIYTGSERPAGVQMAICINSARTVFRSGYTGVVSAGCSDNLDVQLRMAIEEGLAVGPRLLPSGHLLETTGYEGETVPWWRGISNTGTYLFADGPDEFRRVVRTEIRQGVEMIKIQPSGGHGYPSAGGQASFGGAAQNSPFFKNVKFSRDEIAAVVDAAHQRGKRVRAHVAWRDSILECVELGVDVIDHGDEIDTECIAAMAAKGTYWTPSIMYLRRLMDNPAASEPARASVAADYEHVCKMLKEADDAGVRIVTGDDWGIPGLMPHAVGAYAEELELYVRDAGIRPLDVLRWVTANGGELLGGPDLGTVEAGKLADLLVVDGDPSRDISLLRDPQRSLKLIMKDGELYEDTLMPELPA